MNIIKPSATIIEKGDYTPCQFIEKIGRVCYKSEDKITEDSAVQFVSGLIKRSHFAILEHYNVIIQCTPLFMEELKKCIDTRFLYISNDGFTHIISGSFRAFWEAIHKSVGVKLFEKTPATYLLYGLSVEYPEIFDYLIKDLDYKDISACSNFSKFFRIINEDQLRLLYVNKDTLLKQHITHTVKFIIDRGVSHEFVRHRVCAFAQESTRYCNYAKDKFNGEVTFIEPLFFKKNTKKYELWKNAMSMAEQTYLEMISQGASPQEARTVLPNSLKTELVITANEIEWGHIINLRYKGYTGNPHPQIQEAMDLIVEKLCKVSNGRLSK